LSSLFSQGTHHFVRLFVVDKLGRDQVLDYHVRKGMTLQEMER
jgi:hypothetical protein